MQFEITTGQYPLLRVELAPGDRLDAEVRAFVAMVGEAEISSTVLALSQNSLKTVLAGKKSAITTQFVATTPSTITLTSGLVGELAALPLTADKPFWVLPGAYVAHTGDIELGLEILKLNLTTWIPLLSFTGEGTVFLGASGAVLNRALEPEEKMVLDRVHLLACDPTLTIKDVSEAGLWPSLTGQDLLGATGPGRLLYQSLPREQRSTPLSDAVAALLKLR